MTDIYKKITVDLSRKSNTRLIFARQNDIGARKLLITLSDSGALYIPEFGTTASLNFKRADSVAGAVAASVDEDGKIDVTLPQIALSVVGETVCSVSLYDSSGNKLTTSDFYLDIKEELYSGELIDEEPEYSLLQTIFAKLSTYIKEEKERAAAEKIREKNESARELAEASREERIQANLGIGGSMVLSKTGWGGTLTQSLNVDGLGENDLITIFPATKTDREIVANYGLFVESDPIGGSVCFTAEAKPVSDVALKYFITKGRGE